MSLVLPLATVVLAATTTATTAGGAYDGAIHNASALSVADTPNIGAEASERAAAASAILPTLPRKHPRLAAEGAPALEGGDSVQLFRHADPAELQSIRNTGEFRLGPNSTGKYFAETPEHAQQWGEAINNGEGAVVETTVPRSAADQPFRWEKLDGIGPARFVSPDQLDCFNQVTNGIREVP
jgi:hypothetical protein